MTTWPRFRPASCRRYAANSDSTARSSSSNMPKASSVGRTPSKSAPSWVPSSHRSDDRLCARTLVVHAVLDRNGPAQRSVRSGHELDARAEGAAARSRCARAPHHPVAARVLTASPRRRGFSPVAQKRRCTMLSNHEAVTPAIRAPLKMLRRSAFRRPLPHESILSASFGPSETLRPTLLNAVFCSIAPETPESKCL